MDGVVRRITHCFFYGHWERVAATTLTLTEWPLLRTPLCAAASVPLLKECRKPTTNVTDWNVWFWREKWSLQDFQWLSTWILPLYWHQWRKLWPPQVFSHLIKKVLVFSFWFTVQESQRYWQINYLDPKVRQLVQTSSFPIFKYLEARSQVKIYDRKICALGQKCTIRVRRSFFN